MSFNRPALSEVIERIRSDIETRLPGADSRLRHSVLDVLARTMGGAVSSLYGYLGAISDQILPDTADSAMLARHAAVWGLGRKAAVAAQAAAGVTGSNGAAIPAGIALSSIDGRRYKTLAAVVIAGGVATITVEAVDAGDAGTLTPGLVLTFESPVDGVNAAATISSSVLAGSEEESDDALRARLLARIRQTPQGGAASDYVSWALAQPGVTRAWCYPGWLGAGTVGLTFVMDSRAEIIPEPADLVAVQAALDSLRPVTADLTVFAPLADVVSVRLRVSPNTPSIRSAIVAELQDFFAREAQPGGTLFLSRIDEAISQAEGEFQHEMVLPAGNPVSVAGHIAKLGGVTFL